MDSLNQTALMNLENRIITINHDTLFRLILLYIFAMPIVVLANYSKTIKGLFELAASAGKFIFSAPSYIYSNPFQIIIRPPKAFGGLKITVFGGRDLPFFIFGIVIFLL